MTAAGWFLLANAASLAGVAAVVAALWFIHKGGE